MQKNNPTLLSCSVAQGISSYFKSNLIKKYNKLCKDEGDKILTSMN